MFAGGILEQTLHAKVLAEIALKATGWPMQGHEAAFSLQGSQLVSRTLH
jgi:hypothetical protein